MSSSSIMRVPRSSSETAHVASGTQMQSAGSFSPLTRIRLPDTTTPLSSRKVVEYHFLPLLSEQTSIEGLLEVFKAISKSQLATLPQEIRILSLALSHFKTGETPSLGDFEKVISYARRDGNSEILDSLPIEKKLDSEANFFLAAKEGYPNFVELFLNRYGSVLSLTVKGVALSGAAKKGHESIVNLLLDRCGSELSDDDKGAALSGAAENGYESIVNLLLDRCSSEIPIPFRNRTILAASPRGYVQVIRRLLQEGPIDRGIRDSACRLAGGSNPAAIQAILLQAAVIDPVASEATAGGDGYPLPTIDYVGEHAKELLVEFGSGFPARFCLGHTVDLGGVTKQVISTLMSSLVKKGDLNITPEGLPEPAGVEENYTHLGAFCASLWEKNIGRTDRFLIGSLFNPAFFEMIQIVANAPAIAPAAAAAASAAAPSSEDELLKEFARILKRVNPSAKMYCDAYLNEPGAQKDFSDVIGIDISEAEEEAKGMIEPYLSTAKAFYEGTRGAFREALKTEDPETMTQKVQGNPITEEKLLAALTFEPGVSANRISWIKEVITEADDKELLAFVEGITGRRALSPGMQIKIAPGWRSAFEIHTCFNSLYLPNILMLKEAFKTEFKRAVANDSFNIQ